MISSSTGLLVATGSLREKATSGATVARAAWSVNSSSKLLGGHAIETEPRYQLDLSEWRLVRYLTIAVVGLLAVHSLLQIWHYQVDEVPWPLRQLFDVDEEDAIPTWYSTSALLLASVLLLLISRRKQADRDPWVGYWYGLSLTFAALSLDEVAGFHETVNGMVDYSWAILGGIAAAVFGVAYLRFLWHLPARTRWLFVVSGCVFIGGAVGVEMSTDWYDDQDLLDTLAYNLWNTVEEGMEMAGVVLFIYALLGYMGSAVIAVSSGTSRADTLTNGSECV